MSNLDLLDKAFRDHFPVGELVELHYVSVEQRPEPGWYGVVIRLITWEVDAARELKSIVDVKEQELGLPLAGLDLATLGRIRELLEALVRVLAKALDHPEAKELMPHDLVDFSPLKLKAQTADEFAKALEAPSRLGRYLAA